MRLRNCESSSKGFAVRNLLVVVSLVLVSCGSALLAEENWPQFRGPGGEGHADAKGVPLTWNETEHVKWKTAIPGEGWSSPVVWGGQVWLTTALIEDRSLRAICVDRQSGAIVHDVDVFRVEKFGEKHGTNSYASPTPVIESGRVYVHFGTYGTACLDTATAEVIWRNNELKIDHQVGPGSSPVLFGNLLIMNFDGYDARFVAALNKDNGTLAWKTDRPGPLNDDGSINKSFSTPLVVQAAGRMQAISPGAQRVVAYDPVSGSELWKVTYPGFSNVPRPVFGNGLAFIATGYMKPEMWAIRVNGAGDVTKTHVAWKFAKQAPTKSSPLLVGDELYLINDNGVATCLDAKTGKELWVQRFGGGYSASPVSVDGRIYYFGEDGKSRVIQPGPEYKELALNRLDGKFMASPAIAGKAIFLRTTTHLYRVEE
jgi:outer membrane protein assembly factor BamB